MPKFDAISKSGHSHCSWQRFDKYDFARGRTVVPLVAGEMAKAALAFPTAFVAEGDGFVPVAVLSLDSVRNLFVAPDGRWLSSYVPAELRGYPFAFLNNSEGNKVLCIDSASGLLREDMSGEPFFDAEGEVASPTRKVLEFLTAMEAQRNVTAKVCAVLMEAQVVVPWDITLKTKAGTQKINGLYKVDEGALAALSSEAFDTLRKAGAVPFAYYQILSMQNLPALGRLAEAHAAQNKEVENIMKQSFQPSQSNEIEIDWASFSNDDEDTGRS